MLYNPFNFQSNDNWGTDGLYWYNEFYTKKPVWTGLNQFHGLQKTGPRWSGSVPAISGSVLDWLPILGAKNRTELDLQTLDQAALIRLEGQLRLCKRLMRQSVSHSQGSFSAYWSLGHVRHRDPFFSSGIRCGGFRGCGFDVAHMSGCRNWELWGFKWAREWWFAPPGRQGGGLQEAIVGQVGKGSKESKAEGLIRAMEMIPNGSVRWEHVNASFD